MPSEEQMSVVERRKYLILACSPTKHVAILLVS
jgi:hypothetical protein